MINRHCPSGRKRAFTLVEMLCVIMILSSIVAISYPTMVSYYHRRKLSASALEASYELTGARSLSINRVGEKVYGVLFESDGSYRTISCERGRKIDDKNQTGGESAVAAVGEKKYLRTGVSLKNFEKLKGATQIMIMFRADGVPTANAVDFPLPDDLATLKFQSTSTNDEATIKISKITGINIIE